MSVVVFLGPSLALADARAILGDATYLPPIQAGDVYNALARQPTAIAIIDGYFDQVPSVWHKEILYALAQGVPVFGASSMGALRGAELHAFGMIGVGRVFEGYRDGVLEDDDEVAVIHGPADTGYAPLSEAMVNLRDGLAAARDAGIIGAGTCDALIAAAKARFYTERTWPTVYRDGAALGLAADELAALRVWVRETRPNRKRADAIELLTHLAEAGAPRPHVASFEFQPTCHWLEFTLRETRVEGETDTTLDALVQHVAVGAGTRSAVLREALFLRLLAAESERRDLEVDRASLDAAQARLADVAGLADADRDQLAVGAAIAEELIARHLSELGPYVRLVLGERGELERTLAELAAKAPGDETPDDLGALLAWYQARSGIVEATPEDYAKRLGLPSPRAFLDELVAQYTVARRDESPS